MRRVISCLLAVVLIVVVVCSTAAYAFADRGCVVDVLGIKVCGELLTPLPTVHVTNLITAPPVTISIKAPGETVTVGGPTHTVTQPGATTTVYGPTGPTRTVTIQPSSQ